MSKRTKTSVGKEVIILDSSPSSSEDEGSIENRRHGRQAANKAACKGLAKKEARPRPSKGAKPGSKQIQKPPLRQQLTFTVSQPSLSQPSGSQPGNSSPEHQQQQQQQQRTKLQQAPSQPSQRQQPPPLLILSSSSDDEAEHHTGPIKLPLPAASQQAEKRQGPLLRALLSQRPDGAPTGGSSAAAAAAVTGPVAAAVPATSSGPSAAADTRPRAAAGSMFTLRAPAATQSMPEAAAGPCSSSGAETVLWADKHTPRYLEDLRLSMHQKKVQQMHEWLQAQLPHNFRRDFCRLMIITGPPGCCKSSMVRVLADELGFDIVEWTAPTPTMWSEYKYQAAAGSDIPYTSKLDDFETFVSRSKYPALSLLKPSPAASTAAPPSARRPSPTQGPRPGVGTYSQSSLAPHTWPHTSTQAPSARSAAAGSQLPSASQAAGPRGSLSAAGGGSMVGGGVRPKLTLIDDVPYVSDADGRKRLTAALRDLVTTSRSPVVLVATEGASSQSADNGGGGAAGGIKGLHKDILAELLKVGAMTLSLNPVTAANVVKVLQHVAQKEQVQLSAAAAASIAAAADGDLRNALQTLQMLYGQHSAGPEAANTGTNKRRRGTAGTSKRAAAAQQRAINAAPLGQGELVSIAQAQRDQGLQLFHALGKILYNKRRDQGEGEEEEEMVWGADGEVVLEGTMQGGHGRAGGGGAGSSRSRGKSAAALAREDAAAKVRQQRLRADAPGAWLAVAGEMAAVVQLPVSYQRPPMRYDPEALLQQSRLDALGAASFLLENYHCFIADDAVEDAALAACYLSDAATLATARVAAAGQGAGFAGVSGLEEDAVGGGAGGAGNSSSGVMQACAGSVATRGLLFANCHPAPRRFLPMRAPAMGAAARACAANESSLQDFSRQLALLLGTAPGGGSTHVLAAQVLPILRKLTTWPDYHWLLRLMPSEWSYLWEGKVTVVQHGNKGPGAYGSAGGLAGGVQGAGEAQALLSSFVEGLTLGTDGGGEAAVGAQEEDPIEEEI